MDNTLYAIDVADSNESWIPKLIPLLFLVLMLVEYLFPVPGPMATTHFWMYFVLLVFSVISAWTKRNAAVTVAFLVAIPALTCTLPVNYLFIGAFTGASAFGATALLGCIIAVTVVLFVIGVFSEDRKLLMPTRLVMMALILMYFISCIGAILDYSMFEDDATGVAAWPFLLIYAIAFWMLLFECKTERLAPDRGLPEGTRRILVNSSRTKPLSVVRISVGLLLMGLLVFTLDFLLCNHDMDLGINHNPAWALINAFPIPLVLIFVFVAHVCGGKGEYFKDARYSTSFGLVVMTLFTTFAGSVAELIWCANVPLVIFMDYDGNGLSYYGTVWLVSILTLVLLAIMYMFPKLRMPAIVLFVICIAYVYMGGLEYLACDSFFSYEYRSYFDFHYCLEPLAVTFYSLATVTAMVGAAIYSNPDYKLFEKAMAEDEEFE